MPFILTYIQVKLKALDTKRRKTVTKTKNEHQNGNDHEPPGPMAALRQPGPCPYKNGWKIPRKQPKTGAISKNG